MKIQTTITLATEIRILCNGPVTFVIDRLSIKCRITKTKVIIWPITTETDNPMNQSGVEGNACCRRQAWENAHKHVAIGFSLLLIGQEGGAKYFSQSQAVAIQNQTNRKITFDVQLKITLYRHILFGDSVITIYSFIF